MDINFDLQIKHQNLRHSNVEKEANLGSIFKMNHNLSLS